MTLWIVLLIVAAIFFALEFVVPGAILGLIGIFLILLSGVMVANQHGLLWGAVVIATGTAMAIGLFLLELKLLSRGPLARLIEHRPVSQGRSRPATEGSADLLGQRGIALTDMAPTGTVRIAGATYTGHGDSFIHRGTEVEVVAQNTFHLEVRAVRPSHS